MTELAQKLAALRRWLDRDAKWRLVVLLCAAVVGAVIGIAGAAQPIDDRLRTTRNDWRRHQASGDIVLVAIDDKSIERLHAWPWPRAYYADLVEKLAASGAKRIYFDVIFSTKSAGDNDRQLAAAVSRLEIPATFAGLFAEDPVSGARTDILPLPMLQRHARVANINLQYDPETLTVWRLPYAVQLEGRTYGTFSAELAGVGGELEESFPIDHAIDPKSIPAVSVVDVLTGRAGRRAIAGKDVVIGAASHALGDIYRAPGFGLLPGAHLHILGAETLKKGRPLDLGWALPLTLAVLFTLLCAPRRDVRLRLLATLGVAGAFSFGPALLEEHLVFADIGPALAMLSILIVAWSIEGVRAALRARSATNFVSGLPNLNALRQQTAEPRRPLIVARIQNYAEVTAALPPQQEKALVDQIARRLMPGGATELFQGDEGIFAWLGHEIDNDSLGEHLNALHTLFRSPVVIGTSTLDLAVSFGVESEDDRSISNRLGSALVAADEAVADGRKWKQFDPKRLENAAWKLSLLSQLDAAIDNGGLWIAFQPKLDLATGAITGAEALARWTHPDKGPISPMEFIPAAEQSDRIDRLTNFVLDGALEAAAIFNRHQVRFDIAVNLSARLIDDPGLVDQISALLDKHDLAPERLILEITETAALASSPASLKALESLRASGIQISLDDYGTGFSTLEYVKRVPATEIKIDRGFVQAMACTQGDRLMVQSTIQLAHSLGRRVVAEGVEDQETLDALRAMGCDCAQGYLIGRPMPFRALARQLLQKRQKSA